MRLHQSKQAILKIFFFRQRGNNMFKSFQAAAIFPLFMPQSASFPTISVVSRSHPPVNVRHHRFMTVLPTQSSVITVSVITTSLHSMIGYISFTSNSQAPSFGAETSKCVVREILIPCSTFILKNQIVMTLEMENCSAPAEVRKVVRIGNLICSIAHN